MKLPILLSSCLFFLLSLHVGFSQNVISGKITDGQVPLSNVSVKIKGADIGTTTDTSGQYRIQASPKDILVFSYIGKETIEIILESDTEVLNIEMLSRTEKLDEVVVTKKKRNTQENLAKNYFKDSTIVNSNFGYLSPETVGYELRVIDGKNLKKSSRDVLDAIAEQLPGVTIRERQGERYLYTMSRGSLRGGPSAVYEVDGHIYKDAPVWLNVRIVLRVAIIPPQQAVYRYGRIASGGMVVINTNNVRNGLREEGGRPYDLAKLRSNVYNNEALDTQEILMGSSTYLKELYSCTNIEDARLLYEKHKKIHGSLYAFVLDAYSFFQKQYRRYDNANEIINENFKVFEDDPTAMKALAYVYQENGDLTSANKLYKKLFLKRPNYVQSYLDLASSYREIGQYEKAAQLFSRFDYLAKQGYFDIKDSMMVSKIVDREFNNLLALEGDGILSSKELRRLETNQYEFQGTRLVFEWNDGEAEFELQFVNPEGRFYKTEHSLLADGEQIREQKMLGYSMEEFLIDGIMPGQWQVNVKYLGNKQLSPTYLKSTIYHNYGKTNQEKEIKVFKLGLRNVNQELFKVDVSSVLTND